MESNLQPTAEGSTAVTDYIKTGLESNLQLFAASVNVAADYIKNE